jgi:hypothetical protein
MLAFAVGRLSHCPARFLKRALLYEEPAPRDLKQAIDCDPTLQKLGLDLLDHEAPSWTVARGSDFPTHHHHRGAHNTILDARILVGTAACQTRSRHSSGLPKSPVLQFDQIRGT